jgi:chemotaxis signal transduction protein
MDSMSERSDQESTQQTIEAADLGADWDEPSLPSWASDDLAPPMPPEFTTWDSDLPLAGPEDAATPEEMGFPPLFGDLPALAADEAVCVRDAHKRARREQMKEYATRLWIGAPQTSAAMRDPYLICTLADEDFALPLTGVLEVQRLQAVAPVPYTPPWLVGVTNRGGDILSVVDLAGFLGREAAALTPHRRLVVVKASREGLTTGLVVDQVRGIRGLAAGMMGPPSTAHTAAATPFVRGTFEQESRTVAVLDLDDLLLSSRMRRLDLDEADA